MIIKSYHTKLNITLQSAYQNLKVCKKKLLLAFNPITTSLAKAKASKWDNSINNSNQRVQRLNFSANRKFPWFLTDYFRNCCLIHCTTFPQEFLFVELTTYQFPICNYIPVNISWEKNFKNNKLFQDFKIQYCNCR